MKRNVRLSRMLGYVMALGLVVGSLASCGTPVPAPTPEIIKETVVVQETVVVEVTPEPKEPIRVGVGEPLTGPVAYIGHDYNMGLTMAAEEINLEGGIMGHPVQVYFCDNQAQPDKAIACVRKLVEQDNVDILIDQGSSGTTLAAMPLMQEYEVPFLAVNMSHPDITKGTGRAGGNIWAFRLNPHEQMLAPAFADYVAEGIQSISMIGATDASGRAAIATMKPLLEEMGVRVLSEDYVEYGEADYRPLITRWKGLNPDAIYVMVEAGGASVLMRQMQESGFAPKVFSRSGIVTPEFLEMTKDDPSLAEGIMEAWIYPVGSGTDLDQRFADRWGTYLHGHAAMAYLGLRYVIAAAAEAAIQETGEVTRSSLRDALESLSTDVPDLGLIEFDDHNQAHPPVFIIQIKNGKIVVVETVLSE